MISRLLIYLISTIITLIIYLIAEPKQGTNNGVNLLFYGGNSYCYHIHHWIWSTFLIIIVVLSILLSKGVFTPYIIVILGILSGIILSSLKYSDSFSIKQKCVDKKRSPTVLSMNLATD